jgi:hypothetical protein
MGGHSGSVTDDFDFEINIISMSVDNLKFFERYERLTQPANGKGKGKAILGFE